MLAAVALLAGFVPVSAAASTRHPALFGTRGPAIAVQLGRSVAPTRTMTTTTRPLLVMPTRSLLGAPAQNGAAGQAGTAGTSSTTLPLATPASPAVKPHAVPFPDFANPLHRHRMAMPNAAVPAYGDLSF